MSSSKTNVELVFEFLQDKLKLDNKHWKVEVRFNESNSESLAQVFGLLISKFFQFQSLPIIDDIDHSILFTDHMIKSDPQSSRIILFRGVKKNNDENWEIINMSGIDGEQKYSIFWNRKENLELNSRTETNTLSYLTRPDIFPAHTRQNAPVPLWKIAFTSEAQYSASPIKANEMMTGDIIQKLNESGFNKRDVSFLDGTANCGADAINTIFSSANSNYSFQVSAVELDPINYQALKENISLFGCESEITPIHADVVKLLEEPGSGQFDCIYFDPPWGGKEYKGTGKIKLFLSKVNIWKLCKELISKNTNKKLRLIVVKGPLNWDMEDPELGSIKRGIKFKSFRNIVYAYIDIGKL